jgi:hypothetical protein
MNGLAKEDWQGMQTFHREAAEGRFFPYQKINNSQLVALGRALMARKSLSEAAKAGGVSSHTALFWRRRLNIPVAHPVAGQPRCLCGTCKLCRRRTRDRARRAGAPHIGRGCKPTCLCGECRICVRRTYYRQWRRKHA